MKLNVFLILLAVTGECGHQCASLSYQSGTGKWREEAIESLKGQTNLTFSNRSEREPESVCIMQER